MDNKVIQFSGAKNTGKKPGSLVDTTNIHRDNGNGGGETMDNKYVTHKEFDSAMQNINKRFDHIDIKFAEQNLSLYKAMVSVGLGVIAILGFLITLIAFLK